MKRARQYLGWALFYAPFAAMWVDLVRREGITPVLLIVGGVAALVGWSVLCLWVGGAWSKP